MKPKTEELLYLLLWSCEQLARPTWRNLTESFEGWAYRTGLNRQLNRLEQQKFLERRDVALDQRVHRLTERGLLKALGGRNPEACWDRAWDGRWRLAIFDVPLGRDSARTKLRRYLRAQGFGYLQNSVWITPHPLLEERQAFGNGAINVESLIMLEARPCAGETDEQIVAGAWDWKRLEKLYSKHLETLGQRPTGRMQGESAAKALRRWAECERTAWFDAVSQDPLLPERLLPPGYPGRKCWTARLNVLAQAAAQIESFEH